MSEKQAMTKKQIVQDFLKLTEKGEIEKAFDLYVAKTFKHHNPRFKGDRDSLINAMKKTVDRFPNLKVKKRTAIAEGNLVAVHSHMILVPTPENEGLAYMHIFRFSNGKIAEIWDFGQAVPPMMINENGMF